MKAFYSFAVILFLLLFVQCKSKKPAPQEPIVMEEAEVNCDSLRKMKMDTFYTDYIGPIIQMGSLYFIRVPVTRNGTGAILPCDLNDQFKIDGLQVKFSCGIPPLPKSDPQKPLDIRARVAILTDISIAGN